MIDLFPIYFLGIIDSNDIFPVYFLGIIDMIDLFPIYFLGNLDCSDIFPDLNPLNKILSHSLSLLSCSL